MAFSPLEGRRYDMPAMFGPSAIPDKTVVQHARSLVLTAAVSQEAADRLLPNHFRAPEAPLLSVAYVQYDDVDYLGGAGYNEIVVTVSAIHDGPDGPTTAAYAPVLWVNRVGALISGREYMGLPKLFGEIPYCTQTEAGYDFSCYEDETLLLEGRTSDLAPLSAEALAKVNTRAAEVRTFGWKYIPGPDGRDDLDYPLVNVMRWDYAGAAAGRGNVSFASPDTGQAPFSSRAIATLRDIVPQGDMRAFYGWGIATIDRRATTRIGVGL